MTDGQRATDHSAHAPHGRTAALALGAIGVVFGDIGTSPLYAFKECFSGPHGAPADKAGVLGVLSLIVWALTLVVAVKYVAFIMRADNHGEGGILALLALVPPPAKKALGAGGPLVLLVLFGSALLYGDGIITPAISVLSALEGLEIATVALKPAVVPLTVVILIALFLVQRKGTEGIGKVFGPIMVVWFVAIAGLGIIPAVRHPELIGALNPYYAVSFLINHGHHGFLVLGAVVLCVTGGEALYADMGHFGARVIRIAWFGLVMPSLFINYLGQAALVLEDPKVVEASPFYALVPTWGLYPMVALSTMATVIASQALISGAFSLTRQAVQLGYCPRITVVHTSSHHEGQIYVPEVNAFLMISCVALVLAFQSSGKLAAAYGIAVTGTMAATTIAFYVVITQRWGWPVWKALPIAGTFLALDLAFFGANIVKVADGGWVPMLIGLGVFTMMTTWKSGRGLIAQHMQSAAPPLEELFRWLDEQKAPRVPGTAVFLTPNPEGTPSVLRTQFRHNQVLHEQVVLLSIMAAPIPTVAARDRIEVIKLERGFYRVKVNIGFMETPRIPAVVDAAAVLGLAIDPETVTYYLGRETLVPSHGAGMIGWRRAFFRFLFRNARPASAYFQLPPERVIELGTQMELLSPPRRRPTLPSCRLRFDERSARSGLSARARGSAPEARHPRP